VASSKLRREGLADPRRARGPWLLVTDIRVLPSIKRRAVVRSEASKGGREVLVRLGVGVFLPV